ncbi:MAG: sulfatase [Bacteroidota bacterium]
MHSKLIKFLILFVAAGSVMLFYSACEDEVVAPSAPPNILFIFTDDHALQAISAYGSMINQTPNIDRIAREGMLFRHAMVTNSICAPSRAVIQTGKHSFHNGVLDNALEFDASQQTFPKLLQKVGYETAMIGKWHLKSEPTGFDYWKVLPGQGHYYNPDFRTPDGKERIEGYVTDIVTDLSLDWLKDGRDSTQPFLLMCQHKAPHREWSPGPKHLTLYDGQDIPEPATLFDDYATRTSPAKAQEMSIANHMYPYYDNKVWSLADTTQDSWLHRAPFQLMARMTDTQRMAWDSAYGPKNQAFLDANLEGDELTRWKYQRYIKDYLRTIASVDENIGRILDYLDESGLAENTIVIYSSDQGFYLGEHGWYDKRWMYEESLHMPLVVRWPNTVNPGSVNEDLVQNLDFAQTFLDIAGVDQPAEMQGRSFLPILKGEKPEDWRESIYYHYHEFPAVHMVAKHHGVRTGTHKLMRFYETDEWELYDLTTDPTEVNNVYGQEAYADIQQSLTMQLDSLQRMYRDSLAPAIEL